MLSTRTSDQGSEKVILDGTIFLVNTRGSDDPPVERIVFSKTGLDNGMHTVIFQKISEADKKAVFA